MSAQLLEGYPSAEKTAYITAIASISTADQSASPEEIEYLENLAQAAGLADHEKEQIAAAATETSGQSLKMALETLKSSELRFSLMADLMAVAKVDSAVSEEEKQHIAAIADYLQVDENQLTALNDYVNETGALGISGNGSAPGGLGGLLGNLGLGQKLQSSGINIGSLAKGLIAMVGPMIMGNMLNKGLRRTSGSSGFGQSQGGLGSLLGSLSGGRGAGGLGGILSNLLR